ncbi:hypothetical protein [Noviherbaspirillum pedocola]|uniref:Uncharacterized protein n=1 Tax=Noviherbaspirillum pedocola TaxID=2801341 RepID=A0A934SVX6_9BURK|nr:hypothetical protein [Noviherbaspirillum pedocola]MBK4736368.1 hypothetical protein [Noviherbaspirillum pedocola]
MEKPSESAAERRNREEREEREEAERAAREREARAEPGAEALDDARALQQMSEGVVDTSEEFQRIEQKR